MKPNSRREKRKYPRIEAKVKVTFRTMEELVEEYAKNISRGGIFLKTDRLLDPNAEIDLTVSFPDGLGEHQIRGKVTRLMSMSHPDGPDRQLYGVGIQFVDLNPEVLKIVEKVIHEHRSPASSNSE